MKNVIHSILVLAAMSTLSHAAERPNILWITSEDNGPQLGCYGDEYAVTPNLDALAAKGMRYRHFWSTAPVCAPARTTIITGVYPPSMGAQHMRSEVSIPDWMRLYPQFLREEGYYCTNNSKEDYNVIKPGKVWDESSRDAHWKNRAEGQPFFAIFNYTISHESQIRNDMDESRRIHDPARVRVPAYHPDTPEVRKDWAQYYDRMTMMDEMAGNALREIEEAGLADDTIVFYYGDHGSGMPRSKRWPYNSGLHVPLIVHFPEKWKHLAPDEYTTGGSSGRLTGFIDLAPTVLSLAGIEPPDWMQGHAFAGEFEVDGPEYQFAFRGRMDERYDFVRSVTDGRYVYIRHYNPHEIYGQFIAYMFQTPTTRVWHDLFEAGELNQAQSRFWQTKPPEELYDLRNDPDEVRNLAASDEHRERLLTFRRAQDEWALRIRDTGYLPEGEMHARSEGSTPYEMARNESLYPIRSIKDMADRASLLEPGAIDELKEGLSADDSAVRYWAAMGLLMRGGDAVASARTELRAALEDRSPYVRIAAAEALGKHGNPEDISRSVEVLVSLSNIREDGLYTSMMALNAIDELEGKAAGHLEEIQALPRRDEELPGKLGGYVPNLIEKIVSDIAP